MSIVQRLGRGSFVYTTSEIMRNAVALLLLPVYTRYLNPDDYGILTVVTSISGFLMIFFTFGLHSAINRYYFDYRNDIEKLKKFWGTNIISILSISLIFGIILLVTGGVLLKPVLGEVPFWPFVTLGIATAMFQPLFIVHLNILQTTEKSGLYALVSLSQFCVNLFLIIYFVVFLRWGAEGPLTAGLLSMILFFMIAIFALRNSFKVNFDLKYFKKSAKYSVPLIPHLISAQIVNITDKLFINSMVGTATAGIYNIGFMFGGIIALITGGINRAYQPITMDVMQSKDPGKLIELRNIGVFLVFIFCLCGSVVSLFAEEVIKIFTTEIYYRSYIVVPLIAFNFVLGGIYYVAIKILFFVKTATKYISIGTGLGAISNILLNWWLIPKFDIVGAALATMLSTLIGLLFIIIIAHRYEMIDWPYVKFFLLFLVAFSFSVSIIKITGFSIIELIALKIIIFSSLFFTLSAITWRDPLYFIRKWKHIINLLRKK